MEVFTVQGEDIERLVGRLTVGRTSCRNPQSVIKK